MEFKSLPVLRNAAGKLRTVGFELEYAGLEIDKAVQIIQELYGGKVKPEGRFSQKVVDTDIGDFTVEFDLSLLTKKNYKKMLDVFNIKLEDIKLGTGTLEDEVETMLESIVGKIFPYEIASPPIPCTELQQLEKLRERLYLNNAKGTKSFLTNAFGTHINVEAPATDAITLLRYLQALVLLYPLLLEVGQTDLARRVSPFIDPFPPEYVELILASGYKPDLDTLIRDYHKYNPDRNRPLDMYPMFAEVKPEIVERYSDIGKVKPRTTFHYRLPNSCISQEEWSLAEEWNNWVTVETLANDPDKLSEMSQQYLALRKDTFLGFDNKWIKKLEKWLT